MDAGDIFEGTEGAGAEEFFLLLEGKSFRLDRIVSHGQPTPEGAWYDQAGPEWVMLVRGTAEIGYRDGSRTALKAGSWLLIPAGVAHRVEQVSEDAVWLALHFAEEERAAGS